MKTKTTQQTAIPLATVEIFDREARGLYAEGQPVTDARAQFLLTRYPEHFKAGAPIEAPKGGEE